MDFMEENLKSEIEIPELGQRAGYSEYHFCQLFQRATGQSVKRYLVCRRLKHGLYEISKGAKKQEVAFSYGFDTYAGFYKAFYREYGMSPSEYLKAHRPSFPYRVNLLQEGKIMISKKIMEKLLVHWGMEQRPVTNVVYEGSNQVSENEFQVGEDFVLKVSGLPGGLKHHMEIAGELYAVLCKRVQGTKMSGREMFSACDSKAAYRFGTLIGKLHLALANLDAGLCTENRLHDTVHDWALPIAQKKINLLQEVVAEYKNRFCDVYDKLPKQMIHRNMNLSYVYLNGEEMVGVTDFELSEYSIRLFDVCYAATGILSENFADTVENMQKWLKLYQSIVKGYDEVIGLTKEEKQALPYVVFSIQLICVAYYADKEEFTELAKINEKMLVRLMEYREKLMIE